MVRGSVWGWLDSIQVLSIVYNGISITKETFSLDKCKSNNYRDVFLDQTPVLWLKKCFQYKLVVKIMRVKT